MRIPLKRSKVSYLSGHRKSPGPTAESRDLLTLVWQLRRDLRIAFEGGDTDFFAAIGSLSSSIERAGDAAMDWLRLIELVVQGMEREYGKGRGSLKSAEAKTVVLWLLARVDLRLPWVDRSLEPYVLELVVDAAIDAIVGVLNADNSLWRADPDARRPWRPWPATVYFLQRIAAFFLGIFVRPRRARLTPAVRRVLGEIEANGLATGPVDVVKTAADALRWLAKERRRIAAGVDVIVKLVHEAERLSAATGPEKKRYVMNLVWAVLYDAGFRPTSPIVYMAVDSIVDLFVEFAVELLFHREREALSDSTTEAPARSGSAR